MKQSYIKEDFSKKLLDQQRDFEARMLALQLAADLAEKETPSDMVVLDARKFYDFLMEQKSH